LIFFSATRWAQECSFVLKHVDGFVSSNGLGDCLNDEPEISLYKGKEVLPGVVYDGDQQCRITMPNTTLCGFGQENICEILLCQTTPTQCQSKDEPAADGTKCGENKVSGGLRNFIIRTKRNCRILNVLQSAGLYFL
jgi:hypothetical protein